MGFYFLSEGGEYSRGIFFFNDTATTEIYTLSLHDALPISALCSRAIGPAEECGRRRDSDRGAQPLEEHDRGRRGDAGRSEEHTSELQSRSDLVCRLLLEKKNKTINFTNPNERRKKLATTKV